MSIETRLDRLEEAEGDGRPSLVIYEAGGELTPKDEASFIKERRGRFTERSDGGYPACGQH